VGRAAQMPKPAKYTPKGNNELGAKYSYIQRRYYEDYVEEVKREAPNLVLVDLRKKYLYGKIDLDNKVVVPILEKMTGYRGEVKTFNFVADALEDFSQDIMTKLTKGATVPRGKFAGLTFSPRFKNDWKKEYVDYLSVTAESFKTKMLSSAADYNNITNFNQFLKLFLEFSTDFVQENPISFGGYSISSKNDIFTTGLAFDLNNESYGDDSVSSAEYFDDPNFNVYSQSAQNHGFIVDRHNPWRFVVNVASEKMQEYMRKRGVLNAQDMFDKMYFNPLLPEFYEFVKMVSFLYADIFSPDGTVAKICYRNGKTSYSLTRRERYNPRAVENVDELVSFLGYSTWLRAYAYIKAREISVNISQKEFDDIVREACSLQKYLDISKALLYINDKFDPLTISDLQGSPTFIF
jgi:hypothetical protein